MGSEETLLGAVPFARAKARLSELMNEVVRDHRPRIVDRHRGKESMVLVSPEDLAPLLEAFELRPRVSVSEGEAIVRLPELGLIAGGQSYDEALDELVELVEQYAADFFERYDFYVHTDRRAHLPWLLRVALAPPRERRELLTRAPADQLEVSREELWAAIRAGEPVERPVPVDPPEERIEHEAWVVEVLVRDLHMSLEEIATLDPEEARRRVHDHWSRPRESPG